MLVYQMVPGNIVLHIGDSGINHEDIETSPWIKHLVIWNQPLVGGLEHELYFPYIGNVIIPTDELIFFRGVETTNQTIKMIFGYIRIYRNLNSSWQYYKWVYAYFYAIISGILPNSQQSFWGRILTNHHIGYIWCISSWASNCSKPFWPNYFRSHSDSRLSQGGPRWTGWFYSLRCRFGGRTLRWVQQKSSCFSRSQTWDLTVRRLHRRFSQDLGDPKYEDFLLRSFEQVEPRPLFYGSVTLVEHVPVGVLAFRWGPIDVLRVSWLLVKTLAPSEPQNRW